MISSSMTLADDWEDDDREIMRDRYIWVALSFLQAFGASAGSGME